MTTTAATAAPATTFPRAGYVPAVHAEWTKFTSLRSTRVLAVVIGAALPLLALLVGATESLQPDDTILGASLLGGAVISQLLAAVLGAQLMTGELRTGLIRVTLAATPRRLVVLGAKAGVAAAVTFAATLAGGALAYALGLGLLDQARYATGDAWPALLGVALACASIAVLGVAIGAVVRHTAGAVTAVIAVVLLPGMVAPLLGPARRWVGGASLDGVLQKLTQSSDATHEAVGSLGAWPSLAVVAAYTVAAVLAAVWLLRRRDV